MTNGFRRKFICKKCKKESSDQGAGFRNSKEYGKIEYETVDLCETCFYEQLKRNRQNYMLLDLRSRGIVKDFELEKMAELAKDTDLTNYNKLRGELLRRGEFKKGDFKKKRQLMIQTMLQKQKENKARLIKNEIDIKGVRNGN